MFCTLLMYVCGESVCLLKTEMVQKCDKTDFQTGVGEEDFQMFRVILGSKELHQDWSCVAQINNAKD